MRQDLGSVNVRERKKCIESVKFIERGCRWIHHSEWISTLKMAKMVRIYLTDNIRLNFCLLAYLWEQTLLLINKKSKLNIAVVMCVCKRARWTVSKFTWNFRRFVSVKRRPKFSLGVILSRVGIECYRIVQNTDDLSSVKIDSFCVGMKMFRAEKTIIFQRIALSQLDSYYIFKLDPKINSWWNFIMISYAINSNFKRWAFLS